MINKPVPQGPKPFVFVLMPFASTFDDIYTYGIKASADEVGAYAERVDEQFVQGSMVEHIWNQIAKADVIVADMTTKNPNVFYEVGYAHALGKVTVLLTQAAEDIPFDLKHWQHLVYEGSISKLKKQLVPALDWALSEGARGGASALRSQHLSVRLDGQELSRAPESVFRTVWRRDLSEANALTFAIFNNGMTASPEVSGCYLWLAEEDGTLHREDPSTSPIRLSELPSVPVHPPHTWLREPVLMYKLNYYGGSIPPGGFDLFSVYLKPSPVLDEKHDFLRTDPVVRMMIRLTVDGLPQDFFLVLRYEETSV